MSHVCGFVNALANMLTYGIHHVHLITGIDYFNVLMTEHLVKVI